MQLSADNIRISFLILALTLPFLAQAQEWNPRPGWKDSYAVGGVCYCDSNGYDHGLDTKVADTPIGPQNVVDICEAIERVMGSGPTEGRIPYNDIQCGNGPPNDAADEVGCPGRVDIGPAGCNQIGPRWDLETVYANLPDIEEGLDRSNWQLDASNNSSEVGRMIDGSLSSRWATRQFQTPGQYITIDLGETLSFDRITLDAHSNTEDYPRAYSVFVSTDGADWGNPIVSGIGDRSLLDIELPAQTARHIKITQTGSSSNRWWSIHELNIFAAEETEPIDPPTPPAPRPPNSDAHMSPIIDLIIEE